MNAVSEKRYQSDHLDAVREDIGGAVSRPAVVRVLPSGIEFPVGTDETVFEAAQHRGISWPSLCLGNATCTKCFMRVLEGEENLSPMDERERAALDDVRWRGSPRTDERLACCARIAGGVVVHRRSVRVREVAGESA